MTETTASDSSGQGKISVMFMDLPLYFQTPVIT